MDPFTLLRAPYLPTIFWAHRDPFTGFFFPASRRLDSRGTFLLARASVARLDDFWLVATVATEAARRRDASLFSSFPSLVHSRSGSIHDRTSSFWNLIIRVGPRVNFMLTEVPITIIHAIFPLLFGSLFWLLVTHYCYWTIFPSLFWSLFLLLTLFSSYYPFLTSLSLATLLMICFPFSFALLSVSTFPHENIWSFHLISWFCRFSAWQLGS